ncbi:MAG TPA: hypothetical protein VGK21_17645 [Candidatus Angelobacter sp.]
MGGRFIDDETAKKLARVGLLFIVGYAIINLCIWGLLLLSLAGVFPWPKVSDWRTVLIVFSIGLSTICAAFWLGNLVGIFKLNKMTEAWIRRTLIAGLLGAVATAVAKSFKS